jgi:hypothetical protein
VRPAAEMACWQPAPATRRALASTLAIAAAGLSIGLMGLVAALTRGTKEIETCNR